LNCWHGKPQGKQDKSFDKLTAPLRIAKAFPPFVNDVCATSFAWGFFLTALCGITPQKKGKRTQKNAKTALSRENGQSVVVVCEV
jgi:hypothetical protein